jgi:cold shock protein
MPAGKIKKVLPDKGFGFISGGSTDLFFHHSELQGVAIEALSEGQSVQYEVGEGKKGPCAVSVRLATQTA